MRVCKAHELRNPYHKTFHQSFMRFPDMKKFKLKQYILDCFSVDLE